MANSLWNEPFDKPRAWIDLLLLANYEPGFLLVRGIQIDLKRGQVGWSEPRLAQRWQWSRSKVRGFLKLLEKEQQIRIEKNNVSQVITILNYDEYQQEKTADRTAKEQQTGQQKDSDKEIKKNKEIKKFYDEQILIAEKKENKIYGPFVEFLYGKNSLGDPLSGVLSLEKQISFNAFENLIKDYDRSVIKDKLIAMEGYDLSKYKSAPSVLRSWLKDEPKKVKRNVLM